MNTAQRFTPSIKFCSIDECFLFFEGFENYDLKEYGQIIVGTIRNHTGIPSSLGVANTQTLAKVANKLAKKDGILKKRVSKLVSQFLSVLYLVLRREG